MSQIQVRNVFLNPVSGTEYLCYAAPSNVTAYITGVIMSLINATTITTMVLLNPTTSIAMIDSGANLSEVIRDLTLPFVVPPNETLVGIYAGAGATEFVVDIIGYEM